MHLLTDVRAGAANKAGGTGCQYKKGAQKLELQMGDNLYRTTFLILCPFGPKLLICNIPQFKEDLERNVEEFSKFSSKSTVWFRHHFSALWRHQKHSPPQTLLLVHARILGSLSLGLRRT